MKTCLVTGATGLVGGEVARRLAAARPDWRIVRLSRRGPDIAADLAAGPLEAEWGEFHEIVHCAADTRFDRPLEDARRVNVDGTRHVLDAARRSRRIERFLHVSTAYVCGRREGELAEEPIEHDAGFSNTYQQSKYEAEQLAVAAMRDLPVSIVRLSSIAGDAATGEVRQYNYVHQLLRLAPRAPLPVIPVAPLAPVDLVAHDWVADSIGAILARFEPGRVLHLCAGSAHSLNVERLLEILDVGLPRRVPLAEYREFEREALRGDSRLLRDLVRVLGYFLPHLGMHQPFRCERGHAAAPPLPDPEALLRSVWRHCQATHWGLHRAMDRTMGASSC